MTAWSRATCDRCGEAIGVDHPLFTAVRRPDIRWIPFVGCEICGGLTCESCSGAECERCGEPGVRDTFPAVWLNQNRSTIWVTRWCIACGQPTRPKESGVRRPDASLAPEARWYACPSCAAEFCDGCAQRRRARCACGARAEPRGVPPWSAYLPSELRERLRVLDPPEGAAELLEARSDVLREWDRGVLSAHEAEGLTWAIDEVLRELGADPGPSPWLNGPRRQ